MTTNRAQTRSNFLGGEWSPSAQGRIDLPAYDTSLAISYNGYPIEEAAWTKRGGSMLVGQTKNGYYGVAYTWYIAPKGTDTSQLQSVIVEVSYGPLNTGGTCTLQIWQYPYTNNAPVASMTAPWASAQEVQNLEFIATDLGVFILSKLTTTRILTYNSTADTYALNDAAFNKLDGPYLDPLSGASLTQNSTGTVSAASGDITFQVTDSAYTFVASDVGRGIRLWNQPPQWDPSLTYVAGTRVYQDGQFWNALPIWTGAATIDVPAGVVPGTTYMQPVTHGTGADAGHPITYQTIVISPWALAPEQATWGFGYIKSVGPGGDFSKCVVTTIIGLPNAKAWSNTDGSKAGNNGFVIDTWQLGVYTAGQYPACGCWHEGRLFLGGALPGRLDTSKSNGMNISLSPGGALIGTYGALGPLFSPTDQFGNVAADNGISEQFNSDGNNMPVWFIPEQAGVLMGTPTGEWLIQASNQNNVISPTDIQIHKITKYGCLKKHAIRVGIAVAYLQTYGRRVIELVADVFSGRFIGRNLNENSKHLTANQFHELAYQEEPAPLIWARDSSGKLFSCTYRRTSHFGSEDPKFAGWSRHDIARRPPAVGLHSGVASICDTAIPGVEGVSGTGGDTVTSLSSIAMVTGVVDFTVPFTDCQIEVLHPYSEPSTTLNAWNVWHLDGGVSGQFGQTMNMSDAPHPGNIQIGGLPTSYIGTTVSVYLCGLDFGDYVVDGSGTVLVPYGADPDGKGTQAWILANYVPYGVRSVTWGEFSTGASIAGHACWLPCVVGYKFTSVMQPTRPYAGAASSGQTGSAFGKLEKTHQWGGIFSNTSNHGLTVSAKMTTSGQLPELAGSVDPLMSTQIMDFPVVFRHPNNDPVPASTLYSGVFWDTIEGDYNFDNQITITSTRPVPLTVAALSGFMKVEDR